MIAPPGLARTNLAPGIPISRAPPHPPAVQRVLARRSMSSKHASAERGRRARISRDAWVDRPMKNKGLGERFGRNLRSFWVTRRSLGDRGGPWSGSCEVDVAAVGRDRRDRGRFLRADDPRRGCRRRQLALGCARARADDVSKSRRQELVVCRATCVLLVSDLIYARSSVTLAPAFLAGAPASWSWTSRK